MQCQVTFLPSLAYTTISWDSFCIFLTISFRLMEYMFFSTKKRRIRVFSYVHSVSFSASFYLFHFGNLASQAYSCIFSISPRRRKSELFPVARLPSLSEVSFWKYVRLSEFTHHMDSAPHREACWIGCISNRRDNFLYCCSRHAHTSNYRILMMVDRISFLPDH